MGSTHILANRVLTGQPTRHDCKRAASRLWQLPPQWQLPALGDLLNHEPRDIHLAANIVGYSLWKFSVVMHHVFGYHFG